MDMAPVQEKRVVVSGITMLIRIYDPAWSVDQVMASPQAKRLADDHRWFRVAGTGYSTFDWGRAGASPQMKHWDIRVITDQDDPEAERPPYEPAPDPDVWVHGDQCGCPGCWG